MKTKTHQHHHVSVHQKVERFFRHRTVLTVVLSFMALALLKYEVQLLGVIHMAYNQGFGLVASYTPHHDEITRMPIQYGSNVRNTTTSGE